MADLPLEENELDIPYLSRPLEDLLDNSGAIPRRPTSTRFANRTSATRTQASHHGSIRVYGEGEGTGRGHDRPVDVENHGRGGKYKSPDDSIPADSSTEIHVWEDGVGAHVHHAAETATARAVYLRAQAKLLQGQDNRNRLLAFARTNGWCALCPLHEVGYVMSERTENSTSMKMGAKAVGVGQGITLANHIRTRHPDDWERIQRGEPPIIRSATSTPNSTPEDKRLMGEALGRARQIALSHQPVVRGSFSREALDAHLTNQRTFDNWFISGVAYC
ncbi:hypothetical protein A1Q2_01804 [Trichosporon asahii var. asahii CBS 8904]|uniref:Uncharacterized protein n=1 Tax=Trichosporon asahii var. asahii (strain CBS 8904) TaxID=1220162 RepID=K1VTB2_TRIAC|nr:hypothetical protein A1Q2_01804 [Trichosporon asahii var. asahii CBS 8904]